MNVITQDPVTQKYYEPRLPITSNTILKWYFFPLEGEPTPPGHVDRQTSHPPGVVTLKTEEEFKAALNTQEEECELPLDCMVSFIKGHFGDYPMEKYAPWRAEFRLHDPSWGWRSLSDSEAEDVWNLDLRLMEFQTPMGQGNPCPFEIAEAEEREVCFLIKLFGKKMVELHRKVLLDWRAGKVTLDELADAINEK